MRGLIDVDAHRGPGAARTPAGIASLFLIQWGANEGFAIEPLETMFYQVGVELAGGDPSLVHFGYPGLDRGRPRSLPADFGNVGLLDFRDTTPGSIGALASYVRAPRVRLVWFFDVQVVHPLFRALRRAGAVALVGYWGAPISDPMPAWKLLLKRLEVRLSRSRLDALVFESRAMADRAVYGRGAPRRMVHVVPLGIDVRRFQASERGRAHQMLGLPPDRRIVIYAGHVDRRKGVHVLVGAAMDVLGRRSDVCFVLCGNRPGEAEEFERAYRGSEVGRWIRFLGYRRDMPELYAGSYCGVIPSVGWDSFPRTALEMASAGLPVIASRLDGLPEAVLDNETGLLFEPDDRAGLAAAIESLLDRPEVAERLGRRGRARCEAGFTLEIQRRRLVEVARRQLPPPEAVRRPDWTPAAVDRKLAP
jgi:glycosyltransferase involved in cell wall biosynthesis